MPVLDKDLLTPESTSSAPRLSWTGERSALAADALRRSGRLRLRVYGESMLPALWPGDVVEIVRCSLADVRPGEIVLARREDRLFLHRFIASRASGGFLLRGDSMPACDPLFPPEAILGRLAPINIKGQAPSPIAGRPRFGLKGSRALGMLFCHCGSVRRLALKLHSYRKPSQREFQDPQPMLDLSSADPRALSS